MVTNIEIIEAPEVCKDSIITVGDQPNPEQYLYTGNEQSFKYVINSFSIEPEECGPVSYTCEVIDGPRTDLCHLNEGSSAGTFDPITGAFEFVTYDVSGIPAGDYTIRVTGSAGTISIDHTFVMQFIDPCPNSILTF